MTTPSGKSRPVKSPLLFLILILPPVSVGGTAGLFLGCSVLSLIEILYFFTLKAFIYVMEHCVNNDEEEEDDEERPATGDTGGSAEPIAARSPALPTGPGGAVFAPRSFGNTYLR